MNFIRNTCAVPEEHLDSSNNVQALDPVELNNTGFPVFHVDLSLPNFEVVSNCGVI
jgi:hypothetical protein